MNLHRMAPTTPGNIQGSRMSERIKPVPGRR